MADRLSPDQVVRAFQPLIDVFVSRLLVPPSGHQWTSWYRTRARNRQVGGSPESQHLVALAADVARYEHGRWWGAPLWWEEALRQRGLIVVHEADHTHIQLFPAGALRRAGVEFSRLA